MSDEYSNMCFSFYASVTYPSGKRIGDAYDWPVEIPDDRRMDVVKGWAQRIFGGQFTIEVSRGMGMDFEVKLSTKER